MIIKIFLDSYRFPNTDYIENYFSSRELEELKLNEVYEFLKKHGPNVHSCYDPFINRLGELCALNGGNINNEEMHIEIFRLENPDDKNSKYIQIFFDKEGVIEDWYYGYFAGFNK